jgi:hypothetical protein
MRINIIQPDDWLAAFRRAAKRDGVSLSEWLGKLGVAALPAKEAAKLTEWRAAGRPKKPVETGESP